MPYFDYAPYRRRGVPYSSALYGLAGPVSLMAKRIYNAMKAKNEVSKTYSKPNPKRRRRRNKKFKKRVPYKAQPSLKKAVKQLQKKMNSNTSTLTWRYSDVWKLTTSANQAAYTERSFNIPNTIELALAQLRFFDPSNPGTLINGSGATGSYSRKFHVKSSISFMIRNNYQVPVVLKVYKYKTKADTNQDANTAFTTGLADVGNPTATSLTVYPTDSPLLDDLYKLERCTTWRLEPGESRPYSFSTPAFDYDPSDTDTHSLTYQRVYHAHSMLFRVSGVPAHDKTTNTQLGTIAGGIDVYEKQTYIIKYNSGGPSINYIAISDNLDAMTAGPVVSQVVVDNQEYSAA